MTVITGKICDSLGVGLTGQLVVQLAGVVIDNTTTPNTVYTAQAGAPISITSGNINITIEQTEISNVTARFDFYLLDGSGNQISPSVIGFDAIIPNVSSVDFANLIPTGITNPQLDSGALRIARIIASDPTLSAAVRGAPYPKGAYDSNALYGYGDMVSYNYANYICTSQSPIQGINPTNTTYWYKLQVEPTGTTATGDNTAYGVSWNGSMVAPSQNALYAIISTLATQAAIALLAPLLSPNFSGTPTAPNPPSNDNSQRLATTSFVAGNFAPIVSPVFTGNPQAPNPAHLDNSQKLATTSFVQGELSSAISALAPINSPSFTGTPTSITPTAGDNSTNIATTAFVSTAITNLAAIGGDLTGSPSSPNLVATGVTAGTYGSATAHPILTVDAKGRVTSASNQTLPTATPSVLGLVQIDTTDPAPKVYLKATVDSLLATKVNLAGDLTGSISSPALVASGVTAGTYKTANVTVDAKGRITSATAGKLSDLSDAAISSPVNGNILTYNGTSWVNSTLSFAGYAPLASPTFTGTPSAPTPTTTDQTTKLATTAFIYNVLAASPALSGTPTAPTATTGTSTTQIASCAYVVNSLANYATLASPTLTGTPTAPTPAQYDNSTKIATTAFVQNLLRAC